MNSSTIRRTYQRRNRKGNRTRIQMMGLTTPMLGTTLPAINYTFFPNNDSSIVPIDDVFNPISYFSQFKYFFFIILAILIVLAIISIIFVLCLCKSWRKRNSDRNRLNRKEKKRLEDLPDFLDDQNGKKAEEMTLLPAETGLHEMIPHVTQTNGNLFPADNTSATLSLDPMLEQKISRNNATNVATRTSLADNTSVDTLRGSVISSPSQQNSSIQAPPTPIDQLSNGITTVDSIILADERVLDAEKDDDLRDLDLKPIQTHYTKNNSSSALNGARKSTSTIEQSIRREEKRADEQERGFIFGSNSNLYEKELRKQSEAAMTPKHHATSQVSLVSRTSEDSCY